jgi:two-component system OmpR family sensor kinase
MDGLKNRLNESIRFKLSFTLFIAILLVAAAAGLFSFLSALDEAHELQDDVLRQVASLVDRQHLSANFSEIDSQARDGNEESRVIVQRLGNTAPSPIAVDDGGVLPLPPTLPDGLQTLTVAGETFRVLVRTMADGKQIAVSQEVSFRNEIARSSALRTVMPFLILVPVLLLIVADLVRKMFRPIAALSHEIDLRANQDLHPMATDKLPSEIRPFVVAINRLLARIAESMRIQHQFVADAAHELRSPLTALSLQSERLAEAEMSPVAQERLAVLRSGIERNRNLLDQLLALARAQSTNDAPEAPVSVQAVFRHVLEYLMPLAENRRIDIGVLGKQDVLLRVNELDLVVLLRNLADNAIRYTPDGGRVDLFVAKTADGCAELNIRDTGPGIPPAEWERIFDPFYRILGSDQIGSGLGLSIVKAIADRLDAVIQLGFSDEQASSGLHVRILIPLNAVITP